MSICLFLIDCQIDFCEGGALPVTGATKDMERLAAMIKKYGGDIDDIQITMDSHYHMHIAHACFWKDKEGNNPIPFKDGLPTVISHESIVKGDWMPFNDNFKDWVLSYTEGLEKKGRYQLTIWPDHCIIGGPGHNIHPVLFEAIQEWERKYSAIAQRITKGSNPFTEHYSAVKAEVPRSDDPSTQMNGKLINTLKDFDIILTGGEALSHCLNFTVSDTAEEFSEEEVKKFVLLEDGTSNVPGCDQLGQDFIERMTKKGMAISTTDKFFK